MVARSKLPFTVVLTRWLAALVLNTSAVFGSVLMVPSKEAPLIWIWPPFDAVNKLLPLPVSEPAMETTLPVPAALKVPVLVRVLLSCKVPPFVASAVPVLLKLLVVRANVFPAEFALTVPALLNTEPALYSATPPKPVRLPFWPMTKEVVLLSRWMPLLPPAPKLMFPLNVLVPNRCTKALDADISTPAFTMSPFRELPPLVVNTSEPPVPWLIVKLLIAPLLSVKTLLTVIVLAAFAWLPENVPPPCRVNAPLLKKELMVVLWPSVMAAVVLF